MKTFFRANIASLSASFCDYLVTIILVNFLRADPLLAGITGTVVGGIVNFLIGRYWVFKASNMAINLQGKRYFITWLGNLILNSFGLFVLIKMCTVQYMLAKMIVSIIVAVAYNYPIQKRYVFKITEVKR